MWISKAGTAFALYKLEKVWRTLSILLPQDMKQCLLDQKHPYTMQPRALWEERVISSSEQVRSLADTAKRMLVLKVLRCSCLVVVYISASPFLGPFLFLLRFLLIYILNYFWSPENKWRKIQYKYKDKRTHKNEWGSDHMHTFGVGSCRRVCVCVNVEVEE